MAGRFIGGVKLSIRLPGGKPWTGVWLTDQLRAELTGMLFRHGQSGDTAGCPCGLEVESTCDAVDVQAFACEKQVGDYSALHSAEIDFLEANATAGYKLFLVRGLAYNMESSGGEFGRQCRLALLRQLRPLSGVAYFCGLQDSLPKTSRDLLEYFAFDQGFSFPFSQVGEVFSNLIFGLVPQPVYGNVKVVVQFL
jgi:hypothetical protein